MTDVNGNITATIELDPWGSQTDFSSANDAFQPHRFTSYERDLSNLFHVTGGAEDCIQISTSAPHWDDFDRFLLWLSFKQREGGGNGTDDPGRGGGHPQNPGHEFAHSTVRCPPTGKQLAGNPTVKKAINEAFKRADRGPRLF